MERKDYEKLARDLDNINDDLLSRQASKAIRDLCLMVWGSQGRMFENVHLPDRTTGDQNARGDK